MPPRIHQTSSGHSLTPYPPEVTLPATPDNVPKAPNPLTMPMVTQRRILTDFQDLINSITMPTKVMPMSKISEVKVTEPLKASSSSTKVQDARAKKRRDSGKFELKFAKTFENINDSLSDLKRLNMKSSDVVIRRMVRMNMKKFTREMDHRITSQYGVEAKDVFTNYLGQSCEKEFYVSSTAITDTTYECKTFIEMGTAQNLIFPHSAELERLIYDSTHTWGPDVFRIHEISNAMTLTCVAYSIFKERDLFRTFAIPADAFFNYMVLSETHYRSDIGYHNSIHAADVLQSAHILLDTIEVSSFEVLTLLYACAIHDIDHPGLTNQYLTSSHSKLSELYNAESVLENHHVNLGLKLLNTKGCDFLAQLSRTQRISIKKMVKRLVLATDMSNHINVFSVFRQAVYTKKDIVNNDDWSIEHKNQDVLRFVIHFCDLSNALKPLHIYKQWIDRLKSEFFHQGDLERERGVQISPMCDKLTVNFEVSQIFFIEGVVKPLNDNWGVYVDHCPLFNILYETMMNNLDYFKMYRDTQKKKSQQSKEISFHSEIDGARKQSIKSHTTSIKSVEKPPPTNRRRNGNEESITSNHRMRSMLDSGHAKEHVGKFARPIVYPKLDDILGVQKADLKEGHQMIKENEVVNRKK